MLATSDLAEDNRITVELITRAKDGDEQAVNDLLQKFLPLQKSIASRWQKRLLDDSEATENALYRQVSLLFIKEALRFDPDKSPSALVHLKVSVPRAVEQWCRRTGIVA
ncbi:MAG: hypothetical protein ACYC5Y_15000 [Symbiobacteriia bacterium]